MQSKCVCRIVICNNFFSDKSFIIGIGCVCVLNSYSVLVVIFNFYITPEKLQQLSGLIPSRSNIIEFKMYLDTKFD
jgi:hypothetical protein